ncbi:mitochondrial carrier domain-containing protein [Lophiotrema nucula]|uniref:Mitochondrial carrier domain-containing protein n=1 Tax=Lophiotrema nucula TaxID=690887 RepID=A0A6A5ZU12_9PLEO|nr:mitochondrial carrier domain-containing protein [Lophiotrema nucula]
MATAPAAMAQRADLKRPEGFDLYARFALAGALGCSVTHGAFTPVDVVKTRIQLDPATYNRGSIGGFRQVIHNEGIGALATGFGPTFTGYFMQGAFKSVKLTSTFQAWFAHLEKVRPNRTAVYSVSAGCAEFLASVALCPLEATRIRLVSTPGFANGLIGGFGKIVKNEGVSALYAGFGPILFKQVPYTITKFVAFERVSEAILGQFDKSGLIAGFAAAIVSQPADTMLSKINKTKGLPGESTVARLVKIARELGFRGSFAGLPTRLFMVGGLTAGQFGIYGNIKKALGKCASSCIPLNIN